MKKTILIFFIIFLSILYIKPVYAIESDVNIVIFESRLGLVKEALTQEVQYEILTILRDVFGYEENVLYEDEMKLNTQIEITEEKNGKYTLKVGNPEVQIEGKDYTIELKNIDKKELSSKYGAKESLLEKENIVGEKWDIILLAKTEFKEGSYGASRWYTYNVRATKLYSSDDENVENIEISHEKEVETQKTIEDTSVIMKIGDFIDNFKKSPPDTLINLILDFSIEVSDILQTSINMFEPKKLDLKKIKDMKITTTIDSISKIEYLTDFSLGRDEEKEKNKQVIFVKNLDGRYSIKSGIPYIPVDILSFSLGKLEFTDINFFENIKPKENATFLVSIKYYLKYAVRVVLYICVSLTLLAVIWHGVCVVRASMDDPIKKKLHKNALQDFFIAMILLGLYVFILALGIYANDFLLSRFNINEEEDIMPFRIVVLKQDVEFDKNTDTKTITTDKVLYSFNTNISGYFRFKSEINDITLTADKVLYVVGYDTCTIINLVTLVVFLIRYGAIIYLAIIGPIIIVIKVFNTNANNMEGFKNWLKAYMAFAIIPMIFSILAIIELQFIV